MAKYKQIHATCTAIDGYGVLLRGPSASGKSDLALRLIHAGGELVADDRVNLLVRPDGLCASAPKALSGLLEVRGLGILRFPTTEKINITLVCELDSLEPIERIPQEKSICISGIELPLIAISPFEISSVLKVQLALKLVVGSIMRGHDTN